MSEHRLTFKLSDEPILIMTVNHDAKTSEVEFVTNDEVAMYPIIQPQERTYPGIQSRLQYWFQDQRPLQDILIDLKSDGFLYPGQAMLRLDIEDLT